MEKLDSLSLFISPGHSYSVTFKTCRVKNIVPHLDVQDCFQNLQEKIEGLIEANLEDKKEVANLQKKVKEANTEGNRLAVLLDQREQQYNDVLKELSYYRT